MNFKLRRFKIGHHRFLHIPALCVSHCQMCCNSIKKVMQNKQVNLRRPWGADSWICSKLNTIKITFIRYISFSRGQLKSHEGTHALTIANKTRRFLFIINIPHVGISQQTENTSRCDFGTVTTQWTPTAFTEYVMWNWLAQLMGLKIKK